MMLFYEYQLLNLQSLWGILTHMLEQTQIRGRVRSENMESLHWMRTEGIYCSSVVATDYASWIPFSSTERFTSIHDIDLVSLIDFCIVSSDLLSDVLDVRVMRGAELSTDHHLVVRSLRISKSWPNKRSNRLPVTYRIKWEALEDKEVRKQFASSISFMFRQLPDVSEDIEKEWLLFKSAIISSAAESCGRKRLRVAGDSEKRTPWWNQEVKEAIRAKKDTFKAWLQERSSSDLQSRYTEARKAATSAVKKFKEKSWEEFGHRLDSNYFSANKVFWQTIRRLRGKRSSIKDSDGNILTDENKILSRWREYFEDLLNPV